MKRVEITEQIRKIISDTAPTKILNCVASLSSRTLQLCNLSILLFCTIILYSCHQKSGANKNTTYVQDVVIKPEEGTLALSELAHHYRIIQLTGKDLSSIDFVYQQDSLIIVQGGADNSSIHLFNQKGDYIKSLIPKGRGPREAVNITKCRPWGNCLEVLADYGCQLLTYSLAADSVVSKTPLPQAIYSAADFIRLDDNRIVYYKEHGHAPEKEYKIYIYNEKEGRIENKFLPLDPRAAEYISFSQMNHLYTQENKTFFYEVFAPGIYEITPDSISLFLRFNKEEYAFPPKLLGKGYKDLEEFIRTCQSNNYIWGHINLAESNKQILSTYNYKNQVYLNVIYKDGLTSHSYTQIHDDLITDETFAIYDGLNYINSSQGIQYFTLEPYLLKEILQKKKEKGSYDRFKAQHLQTVLLGEEIEEDANTLLIQLEPTATHRSAGSTRIAFSRKCTCRTRLSLLSPRILTRERAR